MDKEKLFTDFPPVSTQRWMEKIRADLKGADFDKKLVWHTDEGFDVQPFYRAEDLEPLEHLRGLPGSFPFVRGNHPEGNNWRINQRVEVKEVTAANREALNAIGNGADSITFVLNESFDVHFLEQLLAGIDVENTGLNFSLSQQETLMNHLVALAGSKKWDMTKIRGALFCQSTGADSFLPKNFSRPAALMEAGLSLPFFHAFTVDASVFHNSGASVVSEMAFGLSMGSQYLQALSDDGFDPKQVASKMRFHFAIGSNYFMEIAKFRALRYLWAKILLAFGVDENHSRLYCHAENGQWNKSLYDPYVNMLRTTTESMSAILGGVDELTVLPFDQIGNDPSEMGKRIARNQQLILKKESFFDKVADPAAGSYYIEVLTDKLIRKAWELFLEIDEMGGYQKAFQQRFVQDRIKQEAQKKNLDVALRKRSVLGVNQYPNTNEQITQRLPEDVFFVPREGEIPSPYRAAAPFESLRYQTDQYAINHPRPKVFLFPFGNVALSRARAQFAANFFGCAGYQITDHATFQELEQGFDRVAKEEPQLVVFCGSDDEYVEWVPQAAKRLKGKSLLVLAGYSDKLVENMGPVGIRYFIHSRCNVLEELKKYQKLLGIENE